VLWLDALAAVHDPRDHSSMATLQRATTWPRCAPTRAAPGGQLLQRSTCSRPARLRVRALGAPRRGAPRLARPAGSALEEHQAAALWQGEDRRSDRLVNTHGEVFEANVGDVEDDAPADPGRPRGSAAQMLAMLHRVQRRWRRWTCEVAMLRLSQPRLVARRTGQRRHAGTRPRQRRRRGWRARALRAHAGQATGRRRPPRRARWNGADLRHPTATPCACAAFPPPRLRRPPAPAEDTAAKDLHLMAKEYKDLVVGLDIGTAKVMAVVAEVLPDGGELRVAGLGVAPTMA
jgi:hypothetical protein